MIAKSVSRSVSRPVSRAIADVIYMGPSLSLDFANGIYAVGAPGAVPGAVALADVVSVARASTAYRTNAAGLLEQVAANQPGFDYDPDTLAPLGLRIEEQRTNRCLWSNTITSAQATIWIGQNGVVDTTISAPDGTFTATRLNFLTAAQTYQVVGVTAGGTITFSWYVRLGTKAQNRYAIYDHTNSAFLVASTVNAAATSTKWTRATVTITVPANCTQIRVYPDRADTGSETGTIYLWGIQLEHGVSATSVIPTTSAQVTRAADLLTVGTLSPWFNAVEGTIISEATRLGGGNTNVIFQFDDGADNNRMLITTAYPGVTGSGVAILIGGASTLSAQTSIGAARQKIGLAYKASDHAVSVGGAAPVTNGSSGVPPVTRGVIGRNAALTSRAYIRTLRYYPRRVSNTDLQVLTT